MIVPLYKYVDSALDTKELNRQIFNILDSQKFYKKKLTLLGKIIVSF
jgi:hypothetical protein